MMRENDTSNPSHQLEAIVKEKEEKEGIKRKMVEHGSHEHPLTLVESCRRGACRGCHRPISSGDQVYECSRKCWNSGLLHEECAELPRKMRHALHPQHTLSQEWTKVYMTCSICRTYRIYTNGMLYRCTSEGCKFVLHYGCAVKDAASYDYEDEDDRRMKISHPSHPKHELKLLRRDCSFKCNACGTTSKESSYTCTADACQYWIHERCASLPQNHRKGRPRSQSLPLFLCPSRVYQI